MTVESGNETVYIQLPELTPDLKRAFQAFYDAALNATQPDPVHFDTVAYEYFDEKGSDPGAIDEFFNSFTPLWNSYLHHGQLRLAASVWNWALRPALAWEQSRNANLHKGAAFYFAAMTAVLLGDLDAGYLYAHRAFEEDRRTHGSVAPRTPSLSLVSIDPDNVHQAFREWVVEKAQFVEASLTKYRQSSGRQLDFTTLRAKFLDRSELLEPTFLFSYCIARLRRLLSVMPGGLESAFASQLHLNILFDLTQVTDALVRRVAANKWQFIDLVEVLSSAASMTFGKAELRKLNESFTKDFNATATQLLDGNYSLSSGRLVAGLDGDLALTYGCRNRGAHHLSGGGVTSRRFDELRQSLLNTVFLAVETLPV
jgi:hypothetical protein